MMIRVAVEAVGLTKRFGRRTALDEVSFAVQQGEIVGLLGPNGAGKTTMIRLLSTVLKPTSGGFSVGGIPSSHSREIRQLVGALPESAGYPGHQTGRDYLRYHARLFGLSRSDADRVAGGLLAEVSLDERGSSRISTYSRGMRQRLGIARALVNDPSVVLLDEPTLGLDPAGQRQVLQMVRDIARGRDATVVLSTHGLSEVEQVCTSVLILDRGRGIISGTVSEVTRSVAVQRSGQLRVPIDLVDQARQALAGVSGLALGIVEGRPDVITISVIKEPDGHQDRSDTGLNTALQAVLSAEVPVYSFEVEGARLNDAFLAMTGEGAR